MYYLSDNPRAGRKKATYYVKDFSGGAETQTDERIKPLSYASELINFSCVSGALKDGGGVKPATLGVSANIPYVPGSSPKRLYYFKTYNETAGSYEDLLLIFCLSEDGGYVYKANLTKKTAFSRVNDLFFSSVPTAVRYTYNGKNVIIFSADGENMKIYDGETVETVSDAPAVTSTCIHGERLFATEAGEKTALWFSDDFDPANWDISLSEAGFIDLKDERGSLLKVVEFGGYVYVFRTYGITRVTAYGDQTEFAADGLSASSGKIYGDSVTCCGDKIIYLAEDGFYCFAGGAPQRFLSRFDEYFAGVDNSGAKGVYYNGELFVILKANFPESGVKNAVLRYNFATKSAVFLVGFNVSDMVVIDGETDYKLIMIAGKNALGEFQKKSDYFGASVEKVWRGGFCDLGKPEAEKTISGISLFADKKTTVLIKSERGEKTVVFGGDDKDVFKKVSLKGKAFSFTIKNSQAESKTARLKIHFEYGDRL